MRFHGGDLAAAVRRFGAPTEDWLDLSTGINPRPWPVPAVPARIWSRLPCMQEELRTAAQGYYGCESLLAVSGSQAAIQAIPRIFPDNGAVALPRIGYREHLFAWQASGREIRLYDYGDLEEIIEDPAIGVVVLLNPNNPGCQIIAPERLDDWLARLRRRAAALVIDEAFMDATPQFSMAHRVSDGSLTILRSAGKFFGLAGIRLGFVLAGQVTCTALERELGPWAVNGPAQWLGIRALQDSDWHMRTRAWLRGQADRFCAYLQEAFGAQASGIDHTCLFVTLTLSRPEAQFWYENLGRSGILIRLLDLDEGLALLRFGLPADADQWSRLQTALDRISDIRDAAAEAGGK